MRLIDADKVVEYYIPVSEEDGEIKVLREVNPATVRQRTGLKDAEGNDISEGDVMEIAVPAEV